MIVWGIYAVLVGAIAAFVFLGLKYGESPYDTTPKSEGEEWIKPIRKACSKLPKEVREFVNKYVVFGMPTPNVKKSFAIRNTHSGLFKSLYGDYKEPYIIGLVGDDNKNEMVIFHEIAHCLQFCQMELEANSVALKWIKGERLK